MNKLNKVTHTHISTLSVPFTAGDTSAFITIPVSESGYHIHSLAGFSCNYSDVNVYSCFIDDTSVKLRIYRNGGFVSNMNISVFVKMESD